MLRTARQACRALGWAIANRHGWFLSWFLRGRLRSLTLPLDRRRSDGYSRPPLGVTLRLTMRCNLRCRMCHVMHAQDETAQRLREVRDIPLDLANRLIDELGELGTYVCFSGGEPMLYEELPMVLRRAEKRRVVTSMATNGTLLEDRAEELVTGGLRVLSVSVLGPPDVHDETVAVPDAFERLARGIEAVDRAKKKHGSAIPATVINCPTTDLNAGRLVEVADLLDEWPLDGLHFQHMWFKPPEVLAAQEKVHKGLLEEGAFGEMGDAAGTTVDTEALAEEIEALVKRRGKHPMMISPALDWQTIQRYYIEPLAPVGPARTSCLWLFTMVHPNGEVSPCEGFNAGNLNDHSLMEIWNGEKLRAFRRTLRECGSLPVCSRCCVLYRRY